LIDLFLDRESSASPSPRAPTIALAPERLAKLAGTFTEPDGTIWEILTNDGIHAQVQGLDLSLQPIDQTHLRAAGAPQAVEISIEDSGLFLVVGSSPRERLRPFTPRALTGTEVRRYSGTYHSSELNVTLRIYGANGMLYLARDLTSPQTLMPVRGDVFTIGPRTMQFERNAGGKVTAIILTASGVDSLRVPRA
jgi:hypothetical protein